MAMATPFTLSVDSLDRVGGSSPNDYTVRLPTGLPGGRHRVTLRVVPDFSDGELYQLRLTSGGIVGSFGTNSRTGHPVCGLVAGVESTGVFYAQDLQSTLGVTIVDRAGAVAVTATEHIIHMHFEQA